MAASFHRGGPTFFFLFISSNRCGFCVRYPLVWFVDTMLSNIIISWSLRKGFFEYALRISVTRDLCAFHVNHRQINSVLPVCLNVIRYLPSIFSFSLSLTMMIKKKLLVHQTAPASENQLTHQQWFTSMDVISFLSLTVTSISFFRPFFLSLTISSQNRASHIQHIY